MLCITAVLYLCLGSLISFLMRQKACSMLRMNLFASFIGDFDQVAVQPRCMTALCGTPGFVEYHFLIASSDSVFVSSVRKDFHYSFIYE